MSVADSIALGIQNADWWDLVPATVGALMGAAAAAIPAWLLARNTSKETLERDRIARREQMEADAFSGVVKLVSIVNGVAALQRTIEEQIAEAQEAGLAGQLWCRVRGLTGLRQEEIKFEARELAVLLAAKEFKYLTEVLLVAERYSTLVAAMQDYADRRRELTDMIPARIENGVGTFILNQAEQERFGPRILELESMIEELRQTAAKDNEETIRVAGEFGEIARRQLGIADFPVLSVPGKDEAKEKAA